jgi:NTE family protein
MRRWIIVFLLLINITSLAQDRPRVALVLSGGAAKGLAHIGVLKALHENGIPIDCIVGTSMGAVVGGTYAAGLPVSEIEAIFSSRDFQFWVTGVIDERYNSYFRKDPGGASFVSLRLSLDSTFNLTLNSTLVQDIVVNYLLAERLAQPIAVAHNDFDSLFVPFRAMASDIITESEVMLDSGSLSDAVRASMAVPMFYEPIKVNGHYLFDGGVYNNFPVNVALREFRPDYVIGVNVSSKIYDVYPEGEDEKIIANPLMYSLLDKSDPKDVPESGVYIQPNLVGYTGFEFSKALALIDSGYRQALRQMDEIKSKIPVRRTPGEVETARSSFTARLPEFGVRTLTYEGFTRGQKMFLDREFNMHKNRTLTAEEVRAGYYGLVTDEYFSRLYPRFPYDPGSGQFAFHLRNRPRHNFQLDVGGVIATRDVSDIYLGVNFYSFTRALIKARAEFYAGHFYKSARVKSRIDFPFLQSFYVEPDFLFNSWDFLESQDLLSPGSTATVLTRIDRSMGANAGFPMGRHYKAVVRGAWVNNDDRYINGNVLTSQDTLDHLKLYGFRAGLEFSSNTLNRKQYANAGRLYSFSFDWYSLTEEFTPGSSSVEPGFNVQKRDYYRIRISLEQYFRKGIYSSGYQFTAVHSNQPAFTNYMGSLVNSPAYYPLADSRTLFLQNFRGLTFVAGGWRNVFTLRKSLDFRLEAYLLKPFDLIVEEPGQRAAVGADFESLFFSGTANLVLHSAIGPVSLSFNYYDDPENQFGVLLHVGYLLFNRTSME